MGCCQNSNPLPKRQQRCCQNSNSAVAKTATTKDNSKRQLQKVVHLFRRILVRVPKKNWPEALAGKMDCPGLGQHRPQDYRECSRSTGERPRDRCPQISLGECPSAQRQPWNLQPPKTGLLEGRYPPCLLPGKYAFSMRVDSVSLTNALTIASDYMLASKMRAIPTAYYLR